MTDRQLVVLRGIARGLSNGELAAELFVSVDTVRTHVHNMLGRLGARNRAHAVALAFERAHFCRQCGALTCSCAPCHCTGCLCPCHPWG